MSAEDQTFQKVKCTDGWKEGWGWVDRRTDGKETEGQCGKMLATLRGITWLKSTQVLFVLFLKLSCKSGIVSK